MKYEVEERDEGGTLVQGKDCPEHATLRPKLAKVMYVGLWILPPLTSHKLDVVVRNSRTGYKYDGLTRPSGDPNTTEGAFPLRLPIPTSALSKS